MGLHGMKIRVSEALSRPTLEDIRKDCQPHGGVETLRLIAERGGSVDQYRLLRIRHDIEYAEWPGQDSEREPLSDEDEDDGDAISSYQAVSSTRDLERDALDVTMFESQYIELEAGEHESFLRQVAYDMGRPGHELYDLVERFRKRKTVHADLSSDKERVRLAFVELGNGLARTFWRHCPGPSLGEDGVGEDKDGNSRERLQAKEEDGDHEDVFDSRGATYVRQQEEILEECGNDDYDNPKPVLGSDAKDIDDLAQSTLEAREARKEARRIAFKKPDIINKFDTDGRPLPEKGVVWSQVTQAFGVEASDSMDSTWSSVVRAQRFQMNQIKHFPAAGEILTMTICGPIVRVWYMNPQRFGSSRGLSLDDPKDTNDIVKVFALFSGPVSNYLLHWKPVAGPKGRLAMKTIDDKPFLLELKDIKSLDTRYDPYGRRTAVWSAGVAQVLSVPGENGPPPPITLEPDEHLVIKTSWHLPYLRHHEHNVYKHVAEKERERKEAGIERDADVAIPELIGILNGDSQVDDRLACIGDKSLSDWTTREVLKDPLSKDSNAEREHLHFTILVTKCRRAVPIGRCFLDELETLEVYRKLFKNVGYLGVLGVHYRDLNLGNILCDEATLTCLLVDLDFARIGTQRRGGGEGEKLKPHETSLDDCISGNLLFMSQHVQKSRELSIKLARLELAQQKQAKAEGEKKGGGAARQGSWRDILAEGRQDGAKELADKIKKLKKKIASEHHRFIDDLESAIYTLLWNYANQKAKQEGLLCGPLYPIGSLDVPAEKEKIWQDPSKYAVGSQDFKDFIESLVVVIRRTQNETRHLDPTEELMGREQEGFDSCDRIMREYRELKKKETATPTDPSAYLPREEKPLLGRTDRTVKRKPTESAQDDQPARGQELPQNFAALSIKDASAKPASPNAGPSTPIKSKLRPKQNINYRE